MNRLFQNWPMHNLVAHPLMQILEWLGLPGIAERVHDATLPATRSRQRATPSDDPC